MTSSEPVETAVAQFGLERAQVVTQPRADLGVHDRGRVAGVLPDPRADLAGQRHVGAGRLLRDELADPLLVRGVAERPQQADTAIACAPAGDQLADRRAGARPRPARTITAPLWSIRSSISRTSSGGTSGAGLSVRTMSCT